MGDIKNSSNAEPYSDKVFPDNNSLDSGTDSFRVQNELMPNNLLGSERINVEQENSGYLDPVNLDDINPSENFGEDLTKNSLPRRTFEGSNVDFKTASLEELREVDLLDLPQWNYHYLPPFLQFLHPQTILFQLSPKKT